MEAASSGSLAEGRVRRQKKDRVGKQNAFERLKQLKGTKNKYEVDTVKAVWEEVDEGEYSRRARDRQDEDWIVDDDGAGYIEDGRDIFDDDVIEDTPARNSAASKKSVKDQKPKTGSLAKPGTIKSMFQAMPLKKKKKEVEVKLEDDDVLSELLEDLHKPSTQSSSGVTLLKKKQPTYSLQSSALGFQQNVTPSANRPRGKQPRSLDLTSPVSQKMVMPVKRRRPDHDSSHPSSSSSTFSAGLSREPCEKSSKNSLQPPLLKCKIEPDDNLHADDDEHMITGFTDDFHTEFDEATTDVNTKLTPVIKSKSEKDCEFDVANEKMMSNIELDELCAQVDFEDDKDHAPEEGKATVLSVNHLLNAWDQLSAEEHDLVPTGTVDASHLPLEKNEDGEEIVNFFWLDAYEEPSKPGTIYLFGKVWYKETNNYVSCCVTVRNIERTIYVLPREKKMNTRTNESTNEDVQFSDVYEEIDQLLASKLKIKEFKSRKVTKSYAFEQPGVPFECDYLEVKYAAQFAVFPSDLQGSTFSHVFGTSTSTLELFLLNRKLKGPGWLQVKDFLVPSSPVSWCKLEVYVMKMQHLIPHPSPPPSPPVTVLSLATMSVANQKASSNEIAAVVGFAHTRYYLEKSSPRPLYQMQFAGVTKPSKSIFPFGFKEEISKLKKKIEIVDNERSLLSWTITKIHRLDPDIIVGHDLLTYDLDILLQRVVANKVERWSRLGRLRRQAAHQSTALHRVIQGTSGRLICDTKLSAKELIHIKSYDLKDITQEVLKKTHEPVSSKEAEAAYSSVPELLHVLYRTSNTATVALELMAELNVLPLATQITSIAGNLLSRTLLGGRSERNEYLLLHAFTEKNFIAPDKNRKSKKNMNDDPEDDKTKKGGRRKPAYSGGLVLEPKKGLYETYVLLMDFNSLYPSIIQEFNICFTTIPKPSSEEGLKDGETVDVETLVNGSGATHLEPGVLPVEIRKLVESRRQVKKLMQNPQLSADMKLQYEIRQKALKLMANSMYGCLGFSNSRFFAQHLAAMVTGKGRQILMHTKELVEKMNLEVVYGDTDSIMVNTEVVNVEEVMRLGNKIKAEINKFYKCLEIDIDGIFMSLLLLKKKKYAARTIEVLPDGSVKKNVEVKGLDIVRRDWAGVACNAGQYVIEQILQCKAKDVLVEEVIAFLEQTAKSLADGTVPLQKLVITKQLTKNPEDYSDKKALPHVNVAVRINSRSGKKLLQGDTVQYIICQDGSTLAASQRAYHVDELKTNSSLKIDTTYYLAHQIHPVMSRICDPIPELDAVTIARCLGLDTSSYRSKVAADEEEEESDVALGNRSDAEKYLHCQRLKFKCSTCEKEVTLETLVSGKGSEMKLCVACSDAQCKGSSNNLWQALYFNMISTIKRCTRTYYSGHMLCDNPSCDVKVRGLSLHAADSQCLVCKQGALHLEFSDHDLHNQLCYFQNFFDLEKLIAACNDKVRIQQLMTRQDERWCRKLKSIADQFLQLSLYNTVDMTQVFAKVRTSSFKAFGSSFASS